MQEFYMVRLPRIYDFYPNQVSPHLDSKIIGFAEITGNASDFIQDHIHWHTSLHVPADNRRLSPAISRTRASPRDPAKWDVGA